MFKNIMTGIFIVIVTAVVLFLLQLYGLMTFKFFAPRVQNIKRAVYEETKSYNHGKKQMLAKHWLEYEKGDSQTKDAIQSVIQTTFADFDAESIEIYKLKQFLLNMRGY